MPVTRSASRSSTLRSVTEAASVPTPPQTTSPLSRKSSKRSPTKRSSSRAQNTNGSQEVGEQPAAPLVSIDVSGLPAAPSYLPAVLTFSFEDAKKHLIDADYRFEDVFSRLKCRPFEELEQVDPFRTLATSILGQQISWLAARSITHRFIRLFNPSLPEKPSERYSSDSESFFPSARQVLRADVATLRSAGLSARKAEYILDLAGKFAEGQLSTEKIFKANDEELAEMLIAVRGIGRWTVDMFAMFSLRRPNILPLGDLGVQRGVARWFLALYSPEHAVMISPKKLPGNQLEGPNSEESQLKDVNLGADSQTTQTDVDMNEPSTQDSQASQRATTPDLSSLPPIPLPTTPSTPVRGKDVAEGRTGPNIGDSLAMDARPPAFTPSINRTLNKPMPLQYAPPALPEGLSIAELKARLTGKKKIKGAILTPKEMEELTETWKPYRSIAVYYMWALAEGDKSS